MPASQSHTTHLLIGVPVDFEQFVERLPASDWLAKFNVVSGDNEADAQAVRRSWDAQYQPFVSKPLNQLVEHARSLGVSVSLRAGLSDVTRATEKGDVVILFAHWKGYEIIFDDLNGLPDVDALIEATNHHQGRLALWLRSRPRSGASVLKMLEEALKADLLDTPDVVDLVFESALTRHTNRRDQLDELLGVNLRPGNRLELFDGLHDRKSVGEAVSVRFSGWLDLTTCTSAVLADYLLRVRNNAFHMVQFEKTQDFLWHAHCVRIVLDLHHVYDLPYLDSRLTASGILKDAVTKAAEMKKEKS